MTETQTVYKLKDSGKRREFGTGAVRDVSEGKGRCDLLPLDVLADHLQDDFFSHVHTYVRTGDVTFLWDAIREVARHERIDIYTAMIEAAKQFEAGCEKYGERNWEKGIPLHCYIDSGVRHYLQYRRGDTDEPHLRAVFWNLLCAIWTHKNKPEMIDLPFKGE